MSNYDFEQRDTSNYNRNNQNERYRALSPKSNYNFVENKEADSKQTNKDLNMSSTTIKSKSSSVSMYLNRRHRESQEKINKIKHEKYAQEKQQMTFKPQISNNSRLIVENLLSQDKSNINYNFHNIIASSVRQPVNSALPPQHKKLINKSKEKPVVLKSTNNLNNSHNLSTINQSSLNNNKLLNQSVVNNNSCIMNDKVDYIQEDYKRITQQRAELFKKQEIQTPKKPYLTNKSSSNLKTNQQNSSQNIISKSAKKLPNQGINDFDTSTKVQTTQNTNSSILQTDKLENKNKPINLSTIPSYAQLSNMNSNFLNNTSNYESENYNIFRAQPINKIVDARNNLNQFYNQNQIINNTKVVDTFKEIPFKAKEESKLIPKYQDSSDREDKKIFSYSNNYIRNDEAKYEKEEKSSNLRKDNLENLKNLASQINKSFNVTKDTRDDQQKNSYSNFNIPSKELNKDKPNTQDYYRNTDQNKSSDIIINTSLPHKEVGNSQYKLDVASKEYLYHKLNQMRELKDNN